MVRFIIITSVAVFLSSACSAQGYWYVLNTQVSQELFDIQFISKNQGWAVGKQGTILHTTNGGTYWGNQTNPNVTTEDLYAVFIRNVNEGYACGADGIFIRTTNGGITWTKPQGTGLGKQIYHDLFFKDNLNGWIVGENGTVQKTADGGNTWVIQTQIANKIFYSITRAVNPATLFVCGDNGSFNKSTDEGQNWQYASLGANHVFKDLFFLSKDIGYMCSIDTVFKTTDGGASWIRSSTNTSAQLNGITMADGNTGWTIVDGATIPFTTDGSATWTIQSSPSSAMMNAICSYTKENAWACGENGTIIKFTLHTPHIESASLVDFGSLLCEPDRYRTLIVKNSGDGALDIFSAKIRGAFPDSLEFAITSPMSFPFTIQPHDSAAFLIHWIPYFGMGPKNAYIEIHHSDLPRDPLIVPFIAQKDSISISLSVGALNFLPTCVGETSERSLNLLVQGTQAGEVVEILKMSGNDEFQLYSPTLPVSVAPKSQLPISIRFIPTSPGNYNAQYRVTVEPCHRQILFNVAGNAIETKIVSFPSFVFLGDITVGKSVSKTIMITTPGPTYANVTSIYLDTPVPGLSIVSAPPVPFKMNPSEQKNIVIKFEPSDTITVVSNLCVEWDKVCADKKCISIDARGVVNPHIIMPPVMSFKPLLCEYSEIDTVNIQNTGSGPLLISNIEIVGKDPGNFKVIEPPSPVGVDTNATLKIIVQFSSADAGDKGALLRLTHNDLSNSPTEIPLMGRKDLVGFYVLGDTLAPMEVCVGKSKSVQYGITNTGSIALQLIDMIIGDGNAPFILQGITTPVTIAPSDTYFFNVVFDPQTAGTYHTTFTAKADKCGFEHLFRVDGIGMKSELTASPPINFGNVKIDGIVNFNVAIKNTGNTKTEVQSVYLNPPVAGMSLEPPPTIPFSLDTTESKSINIKFEPTAEGSFNTFLFFIVSGNCPDTIRIPVFAKGTSSSLTLDKALYNVQLSACTVETTCDTIRLQNPGKSAVTIQTLQIQQTRSTFSITNAPSIPYILNAGAELPLLVCSSLATAQPDSAVLFIESTDTKRPVIRFPMFANRDSVGLLFSSDKIDFGMSTQCDTVRILSLRLTNTGTVADTIQIIQPTDPAFQLIGQLTRIMIPGASENVQLRFAPSVANNYSSTFEVKTSLCKTSRVISLTGIRERSTLKMSVDSLPFNDVNVGTSITKNLIFNNLGTSKVIIDKILFSPVDGFNASITPPISIDSIGVYSLPITFSPSDSKLYQTNVCLILSSPCPDTICINVSGNGVRSNLTLSVSQISFGEMAQCESKLDSIVCTNKGQVPLTLKGSTITGSNPQAFILLNPTTSNEVLNIGSSRVYRISFKPSTVSDGIQSALLHIETFDVQASAVDIPLDGKRVTQKSSAPVQIDFGIVGIGSPQSMPITISNSGTADFRIDSLLLPQMFSSNAVIPLLIKAGAQSTFNVTFIPADSSSVTTSLIAYIHRPCIDSILIVLTGKGREGAIIQTAQVSYGAVARCTTKRDTVIISNNSTENITLNSVFISGIDSSLFSIINKPSTPLIIAPKTQVAIVIAFDGMQASDGKKIASLQTSITFQGIEEIRYSQLSAELSTPAIDIQSPVFNPTIIGQSASSNVVIHNTSKIALHIQQVQSSDTAFVIGSSVPSIPAILQPGDSMTVVIRFAPQDARHYSSNLTIESDLPCPFTKTKSIDAEGVAQNIVSAGLFIGTLHAKLDDVIDIPIMLDTDIGNAHVSEYTGEVQFNRTMLYPLNVKRVSTLSKNMFMNMNYDHAQGLVQVHADGADILPGTGVLAILQCKVLLGNDVETPIVITPKFNFTTGTAQVAKRTNGLFQLEGYCRAEDRLLKITGNYILRQNHPNPFSRGSFGNPQTKIEYEIAMDGFVSLIVYDAWGRQIQRLVDETKTAGRYEVEFNASIIPSGIYFYLLRSGRFSEVKKMVVTK